MQTILLYGYLGREFGRVHRYNVKSPAEAIRALCVTLQGFRQAIRKDGAYRVLVGGCDALNAERLPDPVSQRETLRIVPVIAGAGRGVGQTILGAILTAVGVVFGQTWLVNIGVAMMVGGVAQMIMKTPKATESRERPENRPSFAFDGPVNTIAQGNPVPVLFGGPLMVGSQVVSAGLSTEQI